MHMQLLSRMTARTVSAALLLMLAALSPLMATAQLESSASVCLAAFGGPCDPSVADSDIGTTGATAAIGGACAKAQTGYGHYGAFAALNVTGTGPPAATSCGFSLIR